MIWPWCPEPLNPPFSISPSANPQSTNPLLLVLRTLWIGGLWLCVLGQPALSQAEPGPPPAPGNVLAASGGQLFEISPDGAILKTWSVPDTAPPQPVRDLVTDGASRVQIFHGASAPVLHTWDAARNAWLQSPAPGWSTADSEAWPAGIAPFGRHLFVTDMATGGDGAPRGLLRFDADGYTSERFADGQDYVDLVLGQDFALYALQHDQKTVDIFDPASRIRRSSVRLGTAVRAIAADHGGRLFGADADGRLYRFAAGGSVVQTLATGAVQLIDLDLARDGRLIAGARSGHIVMTRRDLDTVRLVRLPEADAVFVTFVESARELAIHGDGFERGHAGGWDGWIDR